KLTNTAAEPISLARPDNSCRSRPTLSVSDSIAEFNSSTTKTKHQTPTNSANWLTEFANQAANGIEITAKIVSWRKADSNFQLAAKPCIEHFAALIMRPIPVPLGFNIFAVLKTCYVC